MKNNFDQLYNYSIQPSEQVWKEIEYSLDNKKKKRILWWWVIPALISVVSFGYWIYNKNHTTSKADATIQLINNNATELNKINKTKNLNITKSLIIQSATPKVVINKNNAQLKSKKNVTIQSIKINSSKKYLQTKLSVEEYHNIVKQEQATSEVVANNLINKNSNHYAMVQTTELEKNDSNIINIIENKTEIKVTSKDEIANKSLLENGGLNDTLQQPLMPQKTIQKITWSAVWGGGLNYLSRKNIFGEDETMKTFNTLSSSTTTGAANNSNAYISLPKTGAHFSVGINVDYTISKKISLQTGLRYRYLENKLALKADTTAIYPVYYVTGNQIQYINYSNQFELPFNVNYLINPSNKIKISIIGGVNLTWVFKDNWLVAYDFLNRYQPLLYQDKRWLFGIHTGLSVNYNNKFSLSLLARKNMTPVQKTGAKYYWQQLDMQLSIPFKTSKK